MKFNGEGNLLTIATNNGKLQIWDIANSSLIREYKSNSSVNHRRIGTCSWCGDSTIATGSKDGNITIRDIRCSSNKIHLLCGHSDEVCGLKYSYPTQNIQLASGGNDNTVCIWEPNHSSRPIHILKEHNAAIKALDWSPHQNGLLVSGGGTADKKIKFWNTFTGSCLNTIDSGSQVCNILWSPNVNEFITSHGFTYNQLNVWKYPSCNTIGTLTGHKSRVLYLSLSPDGQSVVSGAGDETLRFWTVFPGNVLKSQNKLKSQRLLIDSSLDIR